MFEDDKKEIIENTIEAKREFGYCYGLFPIELTQADIKALNEGKCIAATINAEEYSVFIYKNF